MEQDLMEWLLEQENHPLGRTPRRPGSDDAFDADVAPEEMDR